MLTTPFNLLLSDDDADDCIFFREALAELHVHATLTTVSDGVQLMELLLNREQPLPHVLYLDLNMPRKNGFDCLIEIRRHKKLQQLPVIIFSTSFDIRVVDRLYDCGATHYIRKPAKFSCLKEVISKSLDIISNLPNGPVPKEKFVLGAD